MTNHHPFHDDAEYLDAEYAYLRLRASRINAERESVDARQPKSHDDVRVGRASSFEASLTAAALRHAEDEKRRDLDARLAVHRADGARARLGVDALCLEHDLSSNERLVLIAASISGVGVYMSERVFSNLSFYGTPSVENLCSLLDPKTVGDWLSCKRLFRSDAPLVRAGLLELGEREGEPTPDALFGLEARLSMSAWATVSGEEA